MSYHLEGRLLEVCNCRVLCPCRIGEDPDNGTCDTIVAWRFDRGDVQGVDVSGRTIALMAHVPGNILEGNWRAAVYLDEAVTPAQEEAILAVYTGKLGGPVADLVKLIGEVVSVQKVPITFEVHGGSGTVKIGDAGYAELEPYRKDGYLFQEMLAPHPALAALIGRRVSTVRLIILLEDDTPAILHALWKIPVGDHPADNFWRPGNLLAALAAEDGRVPG